MLIIIINLTKIFSRRHVPSASQDSTSVNTAPTKRTRLDEDADDAEFNTLDSDFGQYSRKKWQWNETKAEFQAKMDAQQALAGQEATKWLQHKMDEHNKLWESLPFDGKGTHHSRLARYHGKLLSFCTLFKIFTSIN